MRYYDTKINSLKIRDTNIDDCELIMSFINKMAVYEKMTDKVETNIDKLRKWVYEEKSARILIAEENGVAVGYCIYYYNYSSFVGKTGIFIEDVFIDQDKRGKGYGTAFFNIVAKIAQENDFGRIEWTCLNWNKPSIDFYLAMGAEQLNEWTIYRLNEEKIRKIAQI